MPLLKSMICFSLVYRDSYSTVGDLGHVLFLTIMVLPWYWGPYIQKYLGI